MMSFRHNKLAALAVPMSLLRLCAAVHEYKGRQELYSKQFPQVLEGLRQQAAIQSTRASNSLEGIRTSARRIRQLVEQNVRPRGRTESEIAGYRDVLALIHATHEAMPLTPAVILQLHRDLYKYLPGRGGYWKTSDNFIEEVLPDGSKSIRFLPLPAFVTPAAVEELCAAWREEAAREQVDPLLLTGAFVLDFLCIHPFIDGNGRLVRLLTLLLLYKTGFAVGRWISLERIIEESKESYYETLFLSSQGWREGRHDLVPWLEYFLSVVLAAYKELAQRVGAVVARRGGKSQQVKDIIAQMSGPFSKEELRDRCPGVSESTINRVLEELKRAGQIVPLGKGRSALWQKLL